MLSFLKLYKGHELQLMAPLVTGKIFQLLSFIKLYNATVDKIVMYITACYHMMLAGALHGLV